jgi:hypothetical protein
VPFYVHTYVWPFAIIWPVFLRYFLTPSLYEKHIGAPEWTFVWCGSIITVQSLVWLSTNWNVNLKALFTSSKAKTVADATLVKVIPIANAGVSEICKIDRDNVWVPLQTSMNYTNPRAPDWWEAECLLSLPKAPVPLRFRQRDLPAPYLRDRLGTEAQDWTLPTLKRHFFKDGAHPDPSALRQQHLRYSRPYVPRALQGACRCPILRLPDLLCWAVDAGRILVLFSVHTLHAGSI